MGLSFPIVNCIQDFFFFLTFTLWLRVPLAHGHLSPGMCVSNLKNRNVYWTEQEAWTLSGA